MFTSASAAPAAATLPLFLPQAPPDKVSGLTGLRRLAGSRGVKCLFFGDPTGKGRHYSGVGGGLGEAVIFGLDWSGRSNLSL